MTFIRVDHLFIQSIVAMASPVIVYWFLIAGLADTAKIGHEI